MGQGDDRRTAVRLQPLQRLIGPLRGHLDPGKAGLSGERFARVDDHHRVIGHCQDLCQRLGDVHGPDDEAAMRRGQHFEEDRTGRRLDGAVAAAMPSFAHPVQRRIVEREIAFDLIAVEQQLPAGREIRRERNGAVVARRRHDMVENAPFHSTRSTKIWILPPQASPTSQAWSLLTPKSKSRGLPSRITSSASLTTAPSTQPPETEPTIAPLLSTASLAPTGRGEEPQVVTTVASATPEPASRQRAACSRISAVSLMLPSPLSSFPRTRESRAPRASAVAPCSLPGASLDPRSRGGDGNLTHAALSSRFSQAEAAMPRLVSGALSTSIKVSRLSKLCTGRNSSTCGIIALIPSDLGSKPS